MKLSLGMKLRPGPWGGGNQFGLLLTGYLQQRGFEISFDLKDRDLDFIVLCDPRIEGPTATYAQQEILYYLLGVNRRALVIHRINECDERKGTTHLNRLLAQANRFTDHTVFISSWVRDLFLTHRLRPSEYGVIRNGADATIFHPVGYRLWNGAEKLRLVTHHWGRGLLKGFDIYRRLDELLGRSGIDGRIEFTYIGNLPDGFHFANARYVEPVSGAELAEAIRQNHVYITASQNEPAGMHHIEAAMCGLPLLYRDSGALPEYCSGFGVPFTAENFEQRLGEMMKTYRDWAGRMQHYPHDAERMCESYYRLFLDLLERREEVLSRRKWWLRPDRIVRTLLPRRVERFFRPKRQAAFSL